MFRTAGQPFTLTTSRARRIWLRAQRLDEYAPFGHGPGATRAAVEHLGYVQIDTINVIERCHHHILFARIPGYQRDHLRQAQSVDKTVFEYWTHALAYLPTRDMRFYVRDMKNYSSTWFSKVKEKDLRKKSFRPMCRIWRSCFFLTNSTAQRMSRIELYMSKPRVVVPLRASSAFRHWIFRCVNSQSIRS